MNVLPATFPNAGTASPTSEKIQTTLYDLVATLNAETGPHEDGVVTAALVHILRTKRVLCTGAFKGYRLTCDRPTRSAHLEAHAMEQVLAIREGASHFARDSRRKVG
jgi:hypothetical protein